MKNVITGEGHIGYIAQNGIVIRNGASATVKDNTISGIWYTPDGTEATGLLNYEAGKVTVSGNRFVDTEVRIDGVVTANVLGHSTTTIRPHGVRVDLRSDAKPAAQAVLGAKLDWKIKVDGSVRLHIKQGFSDHAVYYQHFTDRLGPARGQGLQERPPRPHGPSPASDPHQQHAASPGPPRAGARSCSAAAADAPSADPFGDPTYDGSRRAASRAPAGRPARRPDRRSTMSHPTPLPTPSSTRSS